MCAVWLCVPWMQDAVRGARAITHFLPRVQVQGRGMRAALHCVLCARVWVKDVGVAQRAQWVDGVWPANHAFSWVDGVWPANHAFRESGCLSLVDGVFRPLCLRLQCRTRAQSTPSCSRQRRRRSALVRARCRSAVRHAGAPRTCGPRTHCLHHRPKK